MKRMKPKINLLIKRLSTVVTFSGSFLTISGVVSASELENEVLSQQSSNPSTLPHKITQSTPSSQVPINVSQITVLASQTSTVEAQGIGNLLADIRTTQEAEDLASPSQRACPMLSPAKTPTNGIIKCSQGFGD